MKKMKTLNQLISGPGRRARINNKPVVDADQPLMLQVTAEDVKRSNPKDPGHCAAAIAAMRQEGVTRALVHLSKVYIEKPKHWVRYDAPRSLRDEVIAFDKFHAFEPDVFKLNKPPPSHKLGTKKATPSYPKPKVRQTFASLTRPDPIESEIASSRAETKSAKSFKLRVPAGQEALPKKSNWGKYGVGTPGARPRRHMVTNVRSRPSISTRSGY